MKKLIIALVAVLLIEAGLAAQSPAFTIISPSVNVTTAPSTTSPTTGQLVNFAIGSTFMFVDVKNVSSCTYTWVFGDGIPRTVQTITPGSCTVDPTMSVRVTCINNITHAYADAGIYNYGVVSVSCPSYPSLVPSLEGSRGSLNVTCPPLSFGGCSGGFTTACIPPPLPPGDQGKPYSFNLATRASGGKLPLSFTATSALPTGLTLSSSGVLSGTPSVNGPFSIAVTASDSCTRYAIRSILAASQASTGTFNLTINPCPAVAMTSTSPLPAATAGIPYSFTFSGTGLAPLTFNAGFGMPPAPGLTWNGQTGLLSGVPTVPGNYNLPLSVSDSCVPFPQSSKAMNYLLSVQCQLLSITSPGILRDAMIGQPYSYQVTGSGGQLPYTFATSGGALPPGMSMSSSGLISGTPTTAGKYNLGVNYSDSCSLGVQTVNKTLTLTVNCTPLDITTPFALPAGTVAQPYSSQLLTAGGQTPVTFALTNGTLPPGLTLNTSGLLIGRPSTEGTYRFTINAQDSCVVASQNTQKVFTLVVSAVPPPPCPSLSSISPATLSSATAGQSYSMQLQASGGTSPIVFSIMAGSLPPGLSLTQAGLITGVPSASGTYPFTVIAADSCPSGARTMQKNYTLQVQAPPTVCTQLNLISLSPLPNGMVSQAYAHQLATSGGQPPVNFSIAGGSLPPGLSLTAAGLITGVPAAAGTYSFTVAATDSCPTGTSTAQQVYTLQVQAPPTVCTKLNLISLSPLPNGMVNQVYSYQLMTTGGQSPVTFRVAGGSLPQGLNLTPSGLISGIPSAAGNYSATIRVEDSCPGGAQAVQSVFNLRIDAMPSPDTFVVAASPASLAVPRGTSSVGQVTYTLTGDPSMTGTMTSPLGSFDVKGEVVETNPTPLTVNMIGGTADITEQVLVPVTVIERALQRGSTKITYRREFTGQGGATATAAVSLNVTTEAAAGFAIKRMDLYFTNRRPEVTVPRLSQTIKAFVEIDYTGTGPFEGFWEVDDRVIAFVSRPLTFGTTIVLESPGPPTLPTSDTGVHLVRFVVTSPATNLPMPVATYFVTPEEAVKLTYIKLKTPGDKEVIDFSPQKFTWESSPPAAAYQIIFQARGEKDPVFSAFVKDSSYQLSGAMLKGRFSAGKTVSWKVQAFDAGGNLTGESKAREFTFEAPRGYVPGQILVALEDKAYSEQIIAELAEKYRLKAVETFDLKSILMKLTVFETSEKDIFKIIAEMKKDNRVELVQPNYVMMTHAAGPKVSQYADTVIRLERISPSLRGRGVRIALIDTGVDSSHADLKGQISAARNFVGPEGYRAEIHGTAVAGIISGSGIGVKGISPEAEILALRACRQTLDDAPEAECFTTSLSRAIDNAIRSDAKVINMSFGAVQNDPLLTRLISAGAEKEIIFVAPAGNAAAEHELRFPASHPAVVAVGGFDDRNRPYPNGDIVKKASVSAPAVDVFTTVPGGKYNFLTGTSLSAGYVSGLIALAAERDHALTKAGLPLYHDDFCRWEEELLKISLCGK